MISSHIEGKNCHLRKQDTLEPSLLDSEIDQESSLKFLLLFLQHTVLLHAKPRGSKRLMVFRH